MAFQRGYFDGAGDRASRIAHTVGGFVAPSPTWKKFSREWSAALVREGVKTFHMTDLMACQGEFAHWERGGNRTQRFVRELAGIIRGTFTMPLPPQCVSTTGVPSTTSTR